MQMHGAAVMVGSSEEVVYSRIIERERAYGEEGAAPSPG